MRTSGGRSFSIRMKYSVSPSFDRPSTSLSAMRYEPSFATVEIRREHLVVSARDAIGLAIAQSQLAARHRLVGGDRELHLRAGRREDVAAVFFGVRLEADALAHSRS